MLSWARSFVVSPKMLLRLDAGPRKRTAPKLGSMWRPRSLSDFSVSFKVK